jgi:hypothetical protein
LDSKGVESSKGKTVLEKPVDVEPLLVTKEEETKETLLHYKGAVGKPDGLGGIVILKNSKISKEEVVSCPEGARKKRWEAKERNLLVGEGVYYILQEDMHFKSLSGAACFVSGTSVNGKLAWKSQQEAIAEPGTKESAVREKGIGSKINQICMVIQKVKEEKNPIYDYSRLLQKTYANVAEELNIGKSSVVDKCQRQLGLRAEEFTRYVKEHFDSESDTLYKIVFDAAKTQEEKDLVNRTFDK